LESSFVSLKTIKKIEKEEEDGRGVVALGGEE